MIQEDVFFDPLNAETYIKFRGNVEGMWANKNLIKMAVAFFNHLIATDISSKSNTISQNLWCRPVNWGSPVFHDIMLIGFSNCVGLHAVDTCIICLYTSSF